MKGNRLYIIFIVILLVILIALEYNMPKNFVWNPTFSQYDKQPFGAAIFDDIVSHSIPEGYRIENKTFYQLEQDSLQNTAILTVNEELSLNRVDIESMFNLLDRGNKVMLVSKHFGYKLSDTLGFAVDPKYFRLSRFREYVSQQKQKDSIFWRTDSLYKENIYQAYYHIRGGDFYEIPDSIYTVTILSEAKYTDSLYLPTALRYDTNNSELYLVSSPLLFTNYGMLNENTSAYIFRLLTQMKGMPLIRTEGYNNEISAEAQTPLRYFLSQPPLRWGIYLTLITIVLFMIFTAQRRQRAIPVVRPSENKSLEFVELIGTLYFQKKESANLIRKKYIYFAETIRKTIHVDLDDGNDDEEHAEAISRKTGIEKDKISRLLMSLRRVNESKQPYMTDQLMKKYIDKMNEIINQI